MTTSGSFTRRARAGELGEDRLRPSARRRARPASSALLAAALLACAGCRLSAYEPPPEWAELVRSEPALVSTESLSLRVGVAPPVIALDLKERLGRDQDRGVSPPNLEGLRRETIKALLAAKTFARVESRGHVGEDVAVLSSEAWAARDDLILELEVLDHRSVYLDKGGTYWAWLATYVFWIWPAWWMPSHDFGAALTVRARLRDVQGRHEPLLDKVYRVRAEEAHAELTPQERGWVWFLDFGALWNVEKDLEAEHWRSVELLLGPHARREFQLRLLADLRDEVVEPLRREDPALSARSRKRLALVVGVGAGEDSRVGSAPHAVADAEATAALLREAAGGSLVAGRDLTLLVGERATRAGVLEGIAALSSRAAPADELVIYLAAQGTTQGGAPSLLLYDADADDLEGTSLRLRELSEQLNKAAARRVLLIVDASFARPGAGVRTFRGCKEAPTREALDACFELGPGRAVLLAAGPAQGAHALGDGSVGLFSQVLREGIRGRADLDGDGRVGLAELHASLRSLVAGRAALEGFEQTPLAWGVEHKEGLTWPR